MKMIITLVSLLVILSLIIAAYIFIFWNKNSIGIQGPQGPQGPQGVTGPTGPQGITGLAGKISPIIAQRYELPEPYSNADVVSDDGSVSDGTVSFVRIGNMVTISWINIGINPGESLQYWGHQDILVPLFFTPINSPVISHERATFIDREKEPQMGSIVLSNNVLTFFNPRTARSIVFSGSISYTAIQLPYP